jgi:hypothetical protein
MAHPFPAGTGAAHSFAQITGPHVHPHEHDDLNGIADDHADHITGIHHELDAHDGAIADLHDRVTALETGHSGTDSHDDG